MLYYNIVQKGKRLMTELDKIVNQLNDETSNHSKRVGYYAYIISKEMGYSTQESKDNAIAAITHDLGKKDIDQAVLNKPDKLTEEEFAEIKRHPEAGYQALLQADLDSAFTPVQKEKMLQIALCHHEKVDGNGYPRGLKGDQIPMEANMVCLVDAFDALTAKRVYKQAWGEEEAKEWLLSQEGKMFAPEVTQAYARAHEKIVEIKKYLEDNPKSMNTHDFDREIEFILSTKGMGFDNSQNNLRAFGINRSQEVEFPNLGVSRKSKIG